MKARLKKDTYFGKKGVVFQLEQVEGHKTFNVWQVRPEKGHESRKLYLDKADFEEFFEDVRNV